jgi:hypothetical protein
LRGHRALLFAAIEGHEPFSLTKTLPK